MSLLRKIAFPFSLIYACVVYFRNRLFDIGLLKSVRFDTPTICVGNLSVGGTGKTPMVEYLIGVLTRDFNVAVLTRGYKRKSKGFVLASPDSTVEDLGDEPFQIYSKFPQVAMAVDGNRRNGIAQLEERITPDIILLDDAFQHRKVKADLYVLLTPYENLYVDDWYLPTGNLRDLKSQAGRADLIVVTKCPAQLSQAERVAIAKRLGPRSDQKVLFSYLTYAPTLKSAVGDVQIGHLKSRSFTLVTGIANPKPLVTYLEDQGLSFTHLAFADHHFFSEKELLQLNAKGTILTTEKDFMRLEGKVSDIYYLPVGHSFFDTDASLLEESALTVMKKNS